MNTCVYEFARDSALLKFQLAVYIHCVFLFRLSVMLPTNRRAGSRENDVWGCFMFSFHFDWCHVMIFLLQLLLFLSSRCTVWICSITCHLLI